MTSFFYTDENGQRQGPCNVQQLQTLVDMGILTPDSPLETDTGHKGNAGQIPGLRFITVPPPSPYPRTTDNTFQHETSTRSIFLWPLDFAFRDLRFPVILLWVCRIFYAIVFGLTILSGVWYSFVILTNAARFGQFSSAAPAMAFVAVLVLWIGLVLYIVILRLCYEFFIIVFNWIDATTKAARIYIEEQEKQRK